MAINETARKIHDELFPDDRSTLAVTDPELVEYFDSPTSGWPKCSTSCRPRTTSSPIAAFSCRSTRRSTTTPETREDKGLAVQKEIVGTERVDEMYADRKPMTRGICNVYSALTASATTTPAPAST